MATMTDAEHFTVNTARIGPDGNLTTLCVCGWTFTGDIDATEMAWRAHDPDADD